MDDENDYDANDGDGNSAVAVAFVVVVVDDDGSIEFCSCLNLAYLSMMASSNSSSVIWGLTNGVTVAGSPGLAPRVIAGAYASRCARYRLASACSMQLV